MRAQVGHGNSWADTIPTSPHSSPQAVPATEPSTPPVSLRLPVPPPVWTRENVAASPPESSRHPRARLHRRTELRREKCGARARNISRSCSSHLRGHGSADDIHPLAGHNTRMVFYRRRRSRSRRRAVFAHHLVEFRRHRTGVHLLRFVSGAGQYLTIVHQHRCAAVHLRLARHLAIPTAGLHARTSVVSLGRHDNATGGVECVVVAGKAAEAFAVWVIFMGCQPA